MTVRKVKEVYDFRPQDELFDENKKKGGIAKVVVFDDGSVVTIGSDYPDQSVPEEMA